jgi:hypothetical protein
MFLDGVIQGADADGPSRIPMRVGFAIVPILLVALAYAAQRMVRPRRFAFLISGALVCAIGAAFRTGLEPLQRLLDALRGLVIGALLMGFFMTIDDEGTGLLEGGAKPWRELFMAILLITFGSMPSAIFGGFVLALPNIVLGIVLLVRCIRHDAPVVVPQKSMGAAARVFLAMLFGLLALGFLIVCPMISLGIMRVH